MNDDYEAEINLVARCTCGYVFDHLIYSVENKYYSNIYGYPKTIFEPNICPNCHKEIASINGKIIDNKSDSIKIDFGYKSY